MRYRLFIYNSKAVTTSAPCIGEINRAISTQSCEEWEATRADKHMLPFDAQEIKDKIKTELGTKCKVIIAFPPKDCIQISYLVIVTSYERASEVIPALHKVAMENRLALYDSETDSTFFKNWFDEAFIAIKIRKQELYKAIMKEVAPIRRIRKLSDYRGERDKSAVYSVTLKKAPNVSFSDRVKTFYNCLKHNLREGEALLCRNRSFAVSGNRYEITFILEGYNKHADMIGYCDHKVVKQDLIRRMSVEEAVRWMDRYASSEKHNVERRMLFREMIDRYPNPADRFVQSVRITKWLQKQVFGVRYDGIGPFGDEIIFHVVPDPDETDKVVQFSVLKMQEDSASFILPFINDVYPYFYKRYFLEENHIPSEMWREIVERIKDAKKMIVNDTYNPALMKYVERFNLFVLSDTGDPRPYRTDDASALLDFVYEHRFYIACLYDIFIQWSETQLETYDYSGAGLLFNIKGP